MESCQVMRRKLVTTSAVNMVTGEKTGSKSEWVTEICNTPLFNEHEQMKKECDSCASGWTHKDNYRVKDSSK